MDKPPSEPIRFGRDVCGDLTQAERREWWLANGLGGYAAGTVAGSLTRRYHGLLIAPIHPPLGRVLVFAKAEATLIDGERRYPLCTNRWRDGGVNPSGYVETESFELDGRMPVWRFAAHDVQIEQRIWMEHGHNTTTVAFRSAPTTRRDLQLNVAMLINARDHHGATQPSTFHPAIDVNANVLRVDHAGVYSLFLRACGGTVAPKRDWYENFDLAIERERGLPDSDQHLCVGEATFALRPGVWVAIAAGVGSDPAPDPVESMQRFIERDRAQLRRAKRQVSEMRQAPAWIDRLILAADSFICARPLESAPDGESVIAGYPWFGDWGRDTMIALPGLTLATGRFDSCLRILRTFARFVDRGMLPNLFPGNGERAEYNTVDAALWYIEAWRAYVEATQDWTALPDIFPVLCDIVDWHVRGTRHGIQVNEQDGLLRAGETGVQLTWMDAKLGDWVVTPRIGKPVEINALWYNALVTVIGFAQRLKIPSTRYQALAAKTKHGFQRFLNASGGGLFDVLDGPRGQDATLRPNQIFAVSLAHSPLEAAAQTDVVRVVGRALLTSYGLRSLAPDHPDYRPHYVGGVWERDGSYHQGPVWGWLLGHYALAEYRVGGDAHAAQARLAPLRDHLFDAGLGTVSEIFDGAPPHRPRGCPSQAWSVACTLEAWWRLERAKQRA